MTRTRILAQALLALTAAGAAVAAPLPAFLARVAPGAEVTVIARVRGTANLSKAAGSAQSVEAALRAHANATQGELLSFLGKRNIAGVKPLWAANVVIVTAPRQVIEEMAKLDSVEAIAENEIIPLPKEPSQDVTLGAGEVVWGVKNVKADQVWSAYGVDGT